MSTGNVMSATDGSSVHSLVETAFFRWMSADPRHPAVR